MGMGTRSICSYRDIPATRDMVTYRQMSQGPLQEYFRARFLRDLSEDPRTIY